jgi:uncharacterized protein (TIRG00374 family)
MFHQLADLILGLSGRPVYVIVFLLAFLEAAAFVGFIFPGELAVVLGGVMAFQGRVSLPLIATAAILGAVAGDSAGYSIGKRWGQHLLGTRLGRRIARPKHLARAQELIARRGGSSVVLGRFTAVLRVLVPGLAGMAGMPYRVFLAYNVLGGILWAGAMTLLGYFAGNAWRTVERYAARASVILALLFIAAIAVFWSARWLIRNEDLVRAWWRRQLERPRVAAFVSRFDRQIRWGAERFNPAGAFGLYLTVGVVSSLALVWAFGAALQDVIVGEELALIDRPVANFVSQHRARSVTELMGLLTRLGSPPVVLTLLFLAAVIAAARLRNLQPAWFLAGAVLSGFFLEKALNLLVHRVRPSAALSPTGQFSFPSGHAVGAVALYGGIAFIVFRSSGRLSVKVTAAAAAVFVALVVAVSQVYLGDNYASDVVAGAAVGGAALAISATLWAVWDRLGRTAELRSVRANATRQVLKFSFIAGSLGLAVHLVLLSAPGIHQSLLVLQHLNPGLILIAVALEAGSLLALAQLYRVSIANFDHDIGFRQALRLSMGMFTLTRVLPAGGAAAAVFGAAQLSDIDVKRASGATAIVVAGVLGMATLAAIVGVGAAGSLLRADLPAGYIAPVVILLGIVLGIGFVAYRMARNVSFMRSLVGKSEAILKRLRMKPNLSEIYDVVEELSLRMPSSRELRGLFGWSALNWLLDVAVLWLVFAALGQRLHLGVLLVGYGVANIATALPITPGGLGLVEAGMSSTFTAFGVPGATAVVGVLGYRLISFWLPVLAGVPQYLAAARRVRTPQTSAQTS